MDAIILASSSPRRRELLTQAGIPFTVMPGDVDEGSVKLYGTPSQKAEQLARMKAEDVAKKVGKGIVLGADTIVVCDDEIFGKPADEEHARRMLENLSGRIHLVITGVALVNAETGETKSGHEITKVSFAELTKDEIEAYLKTGEHLGKAGAYGIQGKAALFVKSLNGCYSNVVGLPLQRLYRMLAQLGINAAEWNFQKEE
ncbi:MAG TPA: Maf family protein [Clostridia bacterium]|nr:Maf family protein [Clostridia bacterium]